MLLISIYFGYEILIKLGGKIFSEARLDSITDSVMRVRIQRNAQFQYGFFYWTVVLILMSFIIMIVMTICKAQIFRRIVFAIYFLFILLYFLAVPVKLYTEYKESGKYFQEFCEQMKIIQSSAKKLEEEKVYLAKEEYNDKVLKALINGTNENTKVQVHKELINTTRKMAELLFNWSILLLTGSGYIIFRRLKLIHPLE